MYKNQVCFDQYKTALVYLVTGSKFSYVTNANNKCFKLAKTGQLKEGLQWRCCSPDASINLNDRSFNWLIKKWYDEWNDYWCNISDEWEVQSTSWTTVQWMNEWMLYQLYVVNENISSAIWSTVMNEKLK